MSSIIEKLGGRKLVACLVVLIVSVAAFIVKGDISNNLSDMLKYLITTYIAGNVGTDLVGSLTKKAEGVTDEVTAKVEDTAQKAAELVSSAEAALHSRIDQNNLDLSGMIMNQKTSVEEMQQAIGNLALTVQGMQQSLQYVVQRVPPMPQASASSTQTMQQFFSPPPPQRQASPEPEAFDFAAAIPTTPRVAESLLNPNNRVVPQKNPLF